MALSKKRGGLSQREYAAKQAGGKLNYKTGKVSIQKAAPKLAPKVAPRSSTQSSGTVTFDSNGYGMSVAAPENQWNIGSSGFVNNKNPLSVAAENYASGSPNTLGVNKSGQLYNAPAKKVSSRPKSKSSGSSKSRRSAAASIFNNPITSAPTETSGTIEQAPTGLSAIPGKVTGAARNFLGDLMEGVGKMYGNNGISTAPSTAFIPEEQRANNRQFVAQNTLGMTGANASVGDLGYGYSQRPLEDQPTGYGPNGEIYYNNNPGTNPSLMQSDFSPKKFQRPGSERASLMGEDTMSFGQRKQQEQVDYGARPVNVSPENYIPAVQRQGQNQSDQRQSRRPSPTPFPVNNPFIPREDQGMSIRPELQSNEDQTPIFNTPGTTRRFLGNGYLSTGAFSNGKGDYGVEGASLGMQNDEEGGILSSLKSLLGNTAQAAEMPQQPAMALGTNPFNKFQNYTDSDVYNNLMSKMYANEDSGNDTTPPPAPRSQSFASQAASPAVDPAQLQYERSIKGYDKTYKEQERANREAQRQLAAALQTALKSIEGQYAQSQQEGQQTLDKAKQEDLLKLSGLFNFANQDPNSEQRIQYQQRTNNDYAGQLTDLFSKLTKAKEQDILGAQQNYQTNLADFSQKGRSALNQIQDSKRSAQQNLAQLLYTMKKDAEDRKSKASGGFTPVQQQKYLMEYGKDMQDTLGKYSKSGYGNFGREAAANELAQRWGGIFDEQSIASDIAQSAPDGWEGTYQKMYGGQNKTIKLPDGTEIEI